MGATSPLSVARNTRISLVTGLATYSSWCSTSTEMCAGQLSWVCEPLITRRGGVSPPAFLAYTVIEGGKYLPDPGIRSNIRLGISQVVAPGFSARLHPMLFSWLAVDPTLLTYNNWFFESTASPCGSAKRVCSPSRMRLGASLPCAIFGHAKTAGGC